jgi:hypothetical protein
MPDSLPTLEVQRQQVLQQIADLGDFRSGSITAVVTRCGKPTCHCARAQDPGHGPNLRLTSKVKGKTVTETLSAPGALGKARREIAAFRAFQQHLQALVEINAAICRLRPLAAEEEELTPQEKKRRKRSSNRSTRK